MRKGYNAEWEAKQKLIKEFGKMNIFKIAIGGAVDYLVVGQGKLIKCVECKECHGKKYYPGPDEKRQFERIREFCTEHKIDCEIWIKYPNRGWETKSVFSI